jgi:hypothetical protein
MASVRAISGIRRDGIPGLMVLGSILLVSLTFSGHLIGLGKFSELKMEKSVKMFSCQHFYKKKLLIYQLNTKGVTLMKQLETSIQKMWHSFQKSAILTLDL